MMIPNPTCPTCGTPLQEVRYEGGYFNRDQWDSMRAGDWFCDRCPSNGRGNTSFRYWWQRELERPIGDLS